MKKVLSVLIACMMITVGCSNGKEKEQAVEKPLDVSILLPTSEINVNKEITFRAEVTQNKKVVADAEDVQFEIGMQGEDSLAMLEAENGADGIYSAKYKFTEPGDFYVVAHITARDQHSMPKKDFKVTGATVSNSKGSTKDDHSAHTEGHHRGEVMIHLMGTEKIQVNKENLYTIHIQMDEGEALDKANVRIETWKDIKGKHDYTDAKEVSPGEYEVKYTFKTNGKNFIKVHVEKGELHDHIENEVIVN